MHENTYLLVCGHTHRWEEERRQMTHSSSDSTVLAASSGLDSFEDHTLYDIVDNYRSMWTHAEGERRLLTHLVA